MKILLVSQYYEPENLPINFVTKLLADSNIEIDVLTGKPNYPEGKFYTSHHFFSKIIYKDNIGNNIYRLPIFPRGSGRFRGVKLGINYLSFVISGSILPFFLLRKKKYDAIFVYANSPILKTIPALIIGAWKKTPVILWVQDLWPESFEASGFKIHKWFRSLVVTIVLKIYQKTTIIACQSQGFVSKIHEDYDISHQKLSYLPNTIDTIFENYNRMNNLSIIPELAKHQGKFNIIFTGNIGEAQSIDTILKSARILKDNHPKINFLFIGGGSKLNELRAYAEEQELINITFLGSFPISDMPAILDFASALIITLKQSPIFSLTIPNKLQSYLAAGKPILGAIDGEGACVIEDANCGLVCASEDSTALAAICLEISQLEEEKLASYGENAAQFFQKNYASKKFLHNFYNLINRAQSIYHDRA